MPYDVSTWRRFSVSLEASMIDMSWWKQEYSFMTNLDSSWCASEPPADLHHARQACPMQQVTSLRYLKIWILSAGDVPFDDLSEGRVGMGDKTQKVALLCFVIVSSWAQRSDIHRSSASSLTTRICTKGESWEKWVERPQFRVYTTMNDKRLARQIESIFHRLLWKLLEHLTLVPNAFQSRRLHEQSHFCPCNS
jgi:hypothetical protein